MSDDTTTRQDEEAQDDLEVTGEDADDVKGGGLHGGTDSKPDGIYHGGTTKKGPDGLLHGS